MDDFSDETKREPESGSSWYQDREPETPAWDQAPKAVTWNHSIQDEPEERIDGAYRFTRPEAIRSAYSDAGYVPSEDASAVPKRYHCSEQKRRREKKARRGMSAGAIVALCLVCALLGGTICAAATGAFRKDKPRYPDATQSEPAEIPNEPDKSAGEENTTVFRVAGPAEEGKTVTTTVVPGSGELSATDIYYDLAVNQVVGVKTEITYTNYFGFTTSGAVSGSGFIVSEDGYILTNNHVIEDAVEGNYEVKVMTYDGSEYVAEVVGYDADNDVAVLKIDASGLNAATIGDSEAMRVGEKVYAVGNPLGELEYTMTDGMISALDREISFRNESTGLTRTVNMFQISAAINEGNSGGPVYNSRGEIIGIATSKYMDTGIEGLGFAIPINDAVKIADDLISDGFVRGKAYLGVSAGTVSASAAQYYGLVEGAIINSVTEGSCAEKAGLQQNDIIVALDDYEIASFEDLASAKKNYRAGDSAVVKIYRGGKYLELNLVFDEETPALLEADSKQQEEEEAQQRQPQQRQPSGGFDYFDFFNDFFGGFPFGN